MTKNTNFTQNSLEESLSNKPRARSIPGKWDNLISISNVLLPRLIDTEKKLQTDGRQMGGRLGGWAEKGKALRCANWQL